MEADDLTDVYMRINASGRDDGLARALTTAEEFRAIYRRLDAEREAREALAARVAALEAAQAPPPSPAPTDAAVCKLCNDTGWYELDETRCPRGCSINDERIAFVRGAPAPPPAPAPTDDLRDRLQIQVNLRLAAEAECNALRARLDELEPLVALRPSVLAFASEMERKLSARDRVRGERGWIGCTPEWLYSRLAQEANELLDAIRSCNTMILEEAADVANFAMMIADVCGLLSTERARRRAEEQ